MVYVTSDGGGDTQQVISTLVDQELCRTRTWYSAPFRDPGAGPVAAASGLRPFDQYGRAAGQRRGRALRRARREHRRAQHGLVLAVVA
ncbi:hypothetical protein SANTM175S_06540 [Streptomyces antimycoticus]